MCGPRMGCTIIANAFQSPKPTATCSSPRASASTTTAPGSSSYSQISSARIRRSCLEDLKSLNELYQEAALSETEFLERKEKILHMLKEIK